jgi:DNA-binding NarL/FixJ family response regulator
LAAAGTHGRRVLVVDDDASARELIVALLRDAGYETEEAATGEDALAAARERPPTLAVLDVWLPGISGYEVCRILRNEFGRALSIMFVSGERVESYDRVAGLLIGADDYLVKPFAPDELVARVDGLARRGTVLPSGLALTRRELEVLRLLGDDLSQSEIASRLVISPKTVAKHIEHVLAKLGVHSRAQAVLRAHREGVL